MKNSTSIVLGENFISCLESFKNDNETMLNELRNIQNKENQMIYNKFILECRDFRRNNNIGQQNTKYFNPDNFAFIIALTLNIEKYDKWEDINLNTAFEIEGAYTQKIDETDDLTTWGCDGFLIKGGEKQRCICSHASKTVIYLKSNETNIIIPIGTECIKKHKIIGTKQIKKIEDEIKKTHNKKDCKCEYCGVSFVPKKEGLKNCLSCYLQHKKQCLKCGCAFLPPYKYRKINKKCYKCFIFGSIPQNPLF